MRFLILMMMLTTTLCGGILSNQLELNPNQFLTDQNGVLILNQVITVPIGKSVKIYRPDGFCYTGKVTAIEEENSNFFKIYGTIDNVEDCHFGITLAKGGIVAGAIVERTAKKTYVLEYQNEHKGFVFLFTTKYEIPST
jgi:hypothetical protein